MTITILQNQTPELDLPEPKMVELHLSPDASLPKKHGSRIKASGGSYRHARGHVDTRAVFVPWTTEGRKLANELIDVYGKRCARPGKSPKTVCIVRGMEGQSKMPAWVVVHEIVTASCDPMAALLGMYQDAFDQAVRRKIITE